jgi:aminomethyltransferase
MTATVTVDAPLQRTPLHSLHVACGARMTAFAGYHMPVQFPSGIIKEHLHTRTAAGLFDVSHMGQIVLHPRSGDVADAARALERLVPADIVGLADGRQRYTQFTDDSGGILDDLMVARGADHLALVVNAGRKHADLAHLRAHLSDSCEVALLDDQALLAVQGPQAEAVLAPLAPGLAGMRFMDVCSVTLLGLPCRVARCGYTGEDGFEISVPVAGAETLARRLLDDPRVAPIGLGARDSLRLEAGLCLYGHDIGTDTSPVEAALDWSVPRLRRNGGARAGGFPGAAIILAQLHDGARRRRVGLRVLGRAPVREGTDLYADEARTRPAGTVSSGGYGPSVQAPVAMGHVDRSLATAGTPLFADLRGKSVAVEVCALPFVPHRYRRD